MDIINSTSNTDFVMDTDTDIDTDIIPTLSAASSTTTPHSSKYLADLLNIRNNLFDYSLCDFSSCRDEKIIQNILSNMPPYRGNMIQRHIAAVFSRDAKNKLVHYGFNHLSCEPRSRSNVKQSSVHAEESAIRSLLRSLGLSRSLKKIQYGKWCFLPPTRRCKKSPTKNEYPYHPV